MDTNPKPPVKPFFFFCLRKFLWFCHRTVKACKLLCHKLCHQIHVGCVCWNVSSDRRRRKFGLATRPSELLRFVSISFPPATFPRDIPQTGAPPAVYGHGTRLLTVTPAALRTAGGRGELDADASRPGNWADQKSKDFWRFSEPPAGPRHRTKQQTNK